MWLVFLDTTVSWVKNLQCKCLQFPHINLTVILTQPLTRYSDTHTNTQTGTCASTALFVCHVQHLVHRQTILSKQDLLYTRLCKYGLNKSLSTVIMINVVSGILRWRIGFVLCLYGTLCSAICLSIAVSPCATRAFPRECGLLSRTPGIARGVLLVRLMWAKQRGNKEHGNLQIIAAQKTSCSFTQARKSVLSRRDASGRIACVHIIPAPHFLQWSLCLIKQKQQHRYWKGLELKRGSKEEL